MDTIQFHIERLCSLLREEQKKEIESSIRKVIDEKFNSIGNNASEDRFLTSKILKQDFPWPITKNHNSSFDEGKFIPIPLSDNSDLSACPIGIDSNKNRFPLGAFHIFETLAQVEEQTAEIKFRNMAYNKAGFRYLFMFFELFVKMEKMGITNFSKMYDTLIAISDIAFHIPVGIRYYALSKTKYFTALRNNDCDLSII